MTEAGGGILEKTDEEIEHLFDNFEPLQCDYGDCQNEAKASITCGTCFQARELMCDPHTFAVMLLRQDPNEQIIFDGTCGHRPFMIDCPVDPLT